MNAPHKPEKKKSALESAWTLVCDFVFVSYHLLRMLHGACPRHLYILLGLVFAQAIIPYARWYWFGQLTDEAMVANTLAEIMEPWLWFSSLMVLVLVVDVIAQKVTYSVDEYFTETFAPFLPSARQRYGMSSFQSGNAVYNSLMRAEKGEYSSRNLVSAQFYLFGQVLMVLAGIVTLVGFFPILGVLVAVAALVIVVVEVYCAVRLARAERRHQSDRAETTNLRNQFIYKEKMKPLVLYGMELPVIRRIHHLAHHVSQVLRGVNWQLTPAELLTAITLAIVFALGALITAGYTIASRSPGDLSFLVTSLITVGFGMKGVVDMVGQQALGTDKLVDLFRFMYATPPVPVEASASQGLDHASLPAIRVTNLTFGYETGKPILTQVHALFPAGETTFLVGSNGAGKTTLLNVLSKLYPVPERSVFFSERDISAMDGHALRTRLKHLAQDPHILRVNTRRLLAMTVSLDDEAARSREIEERMWKALVLACIADKIRSFEKGLDEELAIWHDAEEDLSGGQFKKLNIAQMFMAILSGNVTAVVLDEPFHGVEPQHARTIFKNFEALGVTLIMVTHQMEIIPPDARVVFLHRTEDMATLHVSTGTHVELLRTCPPYVQHCAFTPLWLEMLTNGRQVAQPV